VTRDPPNMGRNFVDMIIMSLFKKLTLDFFTL
jgi:hypothetical protein